MKRDVTQHYWRFTIDDLRLWYRELGQRIAGIANLNWPLILITLVGIGLRLWLIRVSPLDPQFSNADDGDYYHRALRFAVTGQYIDDAWLIRPPLHVFFFAFWLRLALVIGQPQLGVLFVQLAQTALGALTIPMGYGIARQLFASGRAGLLYAAFLAFWYPLVEQPSVLFSELVYGFLFLLHVWLLLRFDTTHRWRDLALSGFALGAAALTRSPALYSLAFVVLWIFLREREHWRKQHDNPTNKRFSFSRSITAALVVIGCCLAVVGPWTVRNYLIYRHFIPVDTLGQINLWLDLDKVSRRNENIEVLRQMPQADRATYAMARAREILAEDPLRPLQQIWPTFRYIWKAQYVEDFFVKQSFFGRTLRDTAAFGLFGDLIWVIFTLGGVIGLAMPVCEGLYNRLFFLAWLGYSLFTVMIFHVEPRYLVPIWTLFGLYGAGTWARGQRIFQDMRARPLNGIIATALAVAFIVLLVTYRDYPALITRGLARERAIVAGEQAYTNGDFVAAERAFRTALDIQPNFVDAQVSLGLALAAQGRYREAAAIVQPGSSRQADLVVGALARDTGDLETARKSMIRVEAISGEDTQSWALKWLRPPVTNSVDIGGGLDLGYIAGFSTTEKTAQESFRWLESDGRVVLPLATPLKPGATLMLRLTSGLFDKVPLEIRIGNGSARSITVARGVWRDYRLPIPAELASQTRLVVELHAPTFVPARVDPTSSDARALSLMVSGVRVE